MSTSFLELKRINTRPQFLGAVGRIHRCIEYSSVGHELLASTRSCRHRCSPTPDPCCHDADTSAPPIWRWWWVLPAPVWDRPARRVPPVAGVVSVPIGKYLASKRQRNVFRILKAGATRRQLGNCQRHVRGAISMSESRFEHLSLQRLAQTLVAPSHAGHAGFREGGASRAFHAA